MPRTTVMALMVVVLSILSAWATSASTVLRDYDPALAENDLAEDIAADKVVLKEICWFSCYPPGIEYLYYYCYEDVATQIIDPTGDAISGQEHLRLKNRAKEYATVYNELALEHFDRTGRRSCPADEKWTDAFHRVNEYVRETNDQHSSFGAPSTLDGSFRASMRSPFESDVLMKSVCEIFLAKGIVRNVTTMVHQLSDEEGEVQWHHQFDFRCINGEYEQI